MITQQDLQIKSPKEVIELYKSGNLDQLQNARLTSDQFIWIPGNIILEMAKKGILYTEQPNSKN